MLEMEKRSQSKWYHQPSTKTATSNNCSSNTSTNILKDPTSSLLPQTSAANKEYKSVQALTRFWNSQITSIKTSLKNSKINNNNNNSALNNNNSNAVDQNNLKPSDKYHTLDSFQRNSRNPFGQDSCDLALLRNRDNFELVPEYRFRNTTENFNKYKTADYVKSCTGQPVAPSSTNNSSVTQRSTFPLVGSNSSGDKIHWVTRDETINLAQSRSPINSNSNSSITTNSNSVRISSRNSSICSEMEDKIPPKNDPEDTNSLSSVSVSSLSRKTGRKLSFKTHPTQPRKMIPFNTGGLATGKSKVAALTQRFNQMLDQDLKILDEVKRKGVYVYKTQNHIYKIRDTELKRTNSSPKIPKTNSVSSDDCHNVKQVIEIFEPKTVKPKVPDKSVHVLTYSKELTLRKSQRGSFSNLNTNVPKSSDISPSSSSSSHNSSSKEVAEEISKPMEEDPEPHEPVQKIEEIRPTTPVISDSSVILKIIEDSDIDTTESHTDEVEAPTLPETTPVIDVPIQILKPKSKSYGSRIYEKIRLKFTLNKPKAISSSPEAKIMDAISTVNQKIEHLSKSVNDLTTTTTTATTTKTTNHPNTQCNAILEPNDSFLFRSASRNSFGSSYEINNVVKIVEAVNTSLINRAHSMDETLFPKAKLFMQQMLDSSDDDYGNVGAPTSPTSKEEISRIFKNTDDLISELIKDYSNPNSTTQNDINDDYEYISRPKETTQQLSDTKTVIEEPITIENIYETPKKKPTNADSDIYHSISEMKSSIEAMKKFSDTYSENSYESYDNYESVEDTPNTVENAYEIQDPPEVPPPRKLISGIDDPIVISPPEIPLPKRKNDSSITITTNSTSSSPNYEKIKYTKIPPRPPKLRDSDHIDKVPIQHIEIANQHDDIETRSIISNCYERINSMSRNEFMRMNVLNHSDSMSTLSSEHKTNSLYGTTINSITPPSEGSSENSDEWIDMSDGEERNKKTRFIVTRQRVKCSRSQEWNPKIEPKITSECEDDMYEVSISSASILYLPDRNGTIVPGDGQNSAEPLYQNTVTAPSRKSRSRNNEICDNTNSRTIDKGLSTCRIVSSVDEIDDKIGDRPIESQLISCFMDDSDHHYESLYPMGYAIDKKSVNKVNKIRTGADKGENDDDDEDEEFELISTPTNTTNSFDDSTSSTIIATTDDDRRTIGTRTPNDDDSDSFESEGETDDELNKKNNVNTDIINAKLPDPPPSQAYALLQKLKNFGSLSEISKSISRIGKKTRRSSSSNSTTKIPTTPQTPESMDIYQSAPPSYEKRRGVKTQAPNKTTRKSTGSIQSHDPYENTAFHTPRASQLDVSVPVESPTSVENSAPMELTVTNDSHNLSRKKTKSNTSFKDKLKKSFIIAEVGNSANPNNITTPTSNYFPFNGTRSTFYISDSADLDSGIYSGSADPISTPQSTDESTISLVNTSQSEVNNSSSNQSIDCTTPKMVPPPRRKNKTTRDSPDLTRRKTVIGGMRPNNPPPPPPVKQPKRFGSTLWYAECGVFKQESLNNESNGLIKDGRNQKHSTTSWYADAGLYQTSGDSVASSSGSSGVSTGGEGGPGDDNSHSMFLNEPLYQIYNRARLESITQDINEQEQYDGGYEEVGRINNPDQPANHKDDRIKKYQRPSALQLIEPKLGPSRTLWSQVHEVVNSGILQTMTKKERNLQEAKFEVLTSEASYLKSLSLLRSHFMNHPAFRDANILSSSDRKCLFSQITPVLECSDRLLCDLESCWQDNIMLFGLPKSILKNAEKYFHVYIKYCENQGRLERTHKKLKAQKGVFNDILECLEKDAICCGLSLYSFLMLPMQRVTRFPLLIDAVISKLKIDDEEFGDWKIALATLCKIVKQCNDGANRIEQAYEMEKIASNIEFPLSITPIPIVPVGTCVRPRVLIRSGELTLWKNDDGKITFSKKLTKLQKDTTKIHAFLFTDLLVLAKKKTDDKYLVTDYCQRSMLTLSSGDLLPQHLTKDHMLMGKYWMLMTLLENHDKKTVEMIVSCPSETERLRWIEATEPRESENPDEKLYEQWDCPQVVAIHPYEATQPDEISLELNDVVNVLKKMVDGWYQGERLKDGALGWFPGNYTNEVSSPHVRARNLKQRHRLLVFSANYLESQKKL